MKENKIFNAHTERKQVSEDDINFFDDLARKYKLDGYREKYGLELNRDENNFIIKIGQKTIYFPLRHSITAKKNNLKSEIGIRDYLMEVLKKHGVNY